MGTYLVNIRAHWYLEIEAEDDDDAWDIARSIAAEHDDLEMGDEWPGSIYVEDVTDISDDVEL